MFCRVYFPYLLKLFSVIIFLKDLFHLFENIGLLCKNEEAAMQEEMGCMCCLYPVPHVLQLLTNTVSLGY